MCRKNWAGDQKTSSQEKLQLTVAMIILKL